LELREIRKQIAKLPTNERPVLSRNRGVLTLDYGIYQQTYNLRSFRIEISGGSIGGKLRFAERLALKYANSAVEFERYTAEDCMNAIRHLRQRITNLESGDNTVIAENLTGRDAHSLIGLGRDLERLENVFPQQSRALTGLRKARRNRGIARENSLTSDDLRARHDAVQSELAAQANRGERINRERAYLKVAKQLGLTDGGAVKKCYLKWRQRVG
jgi:hypothetical protein